MLTAKYARGSYRQAWLDCLRRRSCAFASNTPPHELPSSRRQWFAASGAIPRSNIRVALIAGSADTGFA
jgi:hypothetical protein